MHIFLFKCFVQNANPWQHIGTYFEIASSPSITKYIIVILCSVVLALFSDCISSTVYRDHEGLGFLAPKHHTKTSLIFTL